MNISHEVTKKVHKENLDKVRKSGAEGENMKLVSEFCMIFSRHGIAKTSFALLI
jgi:hypothetical protein